MSYKVNLSRASSFSRRKRAGKAMSILREKLEEREGEKVSISPEINSKIWSDGVENPPTEIEVEIVETDTGLKAVPAGSETSTVTEEEQEEQQTDTETDYEEIVSGTVSEAKEQLKELDDPDFEAALEAEKQNKDRKTMKEWIESRI